MDKEFISKQLISVGIKGPSLNCYLSYIKTAFAALPDKGDNITKADLDELISSLHYRKDSLSNMGLDAEAFRREMKTLSNEISALNKLSSSMSTDDCGNGISQKANLPLVKISENAFKRYLSDIYVKSDGKQLASASIEIYFSALKNISGRINPYSIFWNFDDFGNLLKQLEQDRAFNESDHNNVKSAAAIFYGMMKNILEEKCSVPGVELAKMTVTCYKAN